MVTEVAAESASPEEAALREMAAKGEEVNKQVLTKAISIKPELLSEDPIRQMLNRELERGEITIAGINFEAGSSIKKFDPQSGKITAAGKYETTFKMADFVSATVQPDGKLLLQGIAVMPGGGGKAIVAGEVEMREIDGNRWTTITNGIIYGWGRGLSAQLLIDGKVEVILVSGIRHLEGRNVVMGVNSGERDAAENVIVTAYGYFTERENRLAKIYDGTVIYYPLDSQTKLVEGTLELYEGFNKKAIAAVIGAYPLWIDTTTIPGEIQLYLTSLDSHVHPKHAKEIEVVIMDPENVRTNFGRISGEWRPIGGG